MQKNVCQYIKYRLILLVKTNKLCYNLLVYIKHIRINMHIEVVYVVR